MAFDREQLLRTAAEVLGLEPDRVVPELCAEECDAWDSFGHLNLVLAVEEAFGVRLPSEVVPELRDLAGIEGAVRRALGEGPETGGESPPQSSPLEPGAPAGSGEGAPARMEEPSDRHEVEIGRDTHIDARVVAMGEDVRIDAGTRIRVDRLELGDGVRIGRDCDLQAHALILGAGTIVGDRVHCDVSGDGLSAESVLRTGRACSITQEVRINLARAVMLGDEAALSPRTMVFTHAYWGSVLEGHEAPLAPVEIASGAWVGAACTLLPGTRIGEGASVVANSCVSGDVPPGALAGGVPAQILRAGRTHPLDPELWEVRALELVQDFAAWCATRGCAVAPDPARAWTWTIRLPDGSVERLAFGGEDPTGIRVGFDLRGEGARLDLARREVSGPRTPLSEELRNFLRRRGVRLAPWGWQYDPALGLRRFE